MLYKAKLPIVLTGLFVALLLAVALLVAFVIPSSAAQAASCDGTKTVIISCEDGENGIWAMLLLIIQIMTAGVGILAVAGIVYASVLWTTAEDKQDQVTKAKGIITNVVIGLIAFALMWAGLQFIVPGGVFNRTLGFTNVENETDKLPDVEDGAVDSGGGGGSGPESSPDSKTYTLSDIKKVKNLRDSSATNNIIKSATLYRSGELANLNENNAEKLGSILGSDATIIDLRIPGGERGKPDKDIPGAANKAFPIEGILDQEPMVTDKSRSSQLSKALKAAANAKGPVLVHCFSGKDRTGWMIAMIMYANGANDAQVMKEYLKSNEAIPGGVKPEWMKSGIEAARSKHGTVISYLKSIGLTNDDLAKLRKKFGA